LLDKSVVKAQSSTLELPLKLSSWNLRGDSGIPNVEVKFVDIWRNTGGEGGYLDEY
jgi:hypothetical protein